jgi:CheY-specific phosphatase CheX
LKKVVSFNKKGISVLIESLMRVREGCGTIVGFCDYNEKKYKMILDMFEKGLDFTLFDSTEVALMFLGDDVSSYKEKKILIHVESQEQKNQLAVELYERGLSPIVAKDEHDFLEQRNDADIIIERSYLGKLDKSPGVYIKDNIVIYTLKGFVDSSIANKFDMSYHEHSLKLGFKLFLFESSKVSSINIHGADFLTKISTAGAEYGASIAMCGLDSRKISEKIKEDLEDAGILVYPSMKDFFEDEDIIKEAHEDVGASFKRGEITKRHISILPVITEACVKTIEVLSGYNAKKKSAEVQDLKVEDNDGLLCTSIGFYGDIEGVLVLVLEKSIAQKACKILLEEDSDEHDLIDALAEFIHIIGGKIVSLLRKRSIKIEVTMPRTFNSLDELRTLEKDIRGAQVNLEIENKDMILFLTR